MISKIIQALEKETYHTKDYPEFYAEHTLDPQVFSIEVQGLGHISMPLDVHVVECLLKISSPAKFGLREKTLLDKKVRDTHEIPADQLRITYDREIMHNMLEGMRSTLGLPENAVLTPHLHNMLIYTPGQFFKAHQDSEKIDGMIATLIVVLPSAHIGGDLIITHAGQQYRFTSENLADQTLKCIVFYADCQHEIEKIKQGYRLALTYNVVLEPAQLLPFQEEKYVNKNLEQALGDYFSSRINQGNTPIKLGYFLDHSYTEHSLRWDLLKGADYQNAQAFRHAARKLGLIPHLALADIHESWAAYGDENDPEPEELVDGDTTLVYWLDTENRPMSYGDNYFSDDEICWTKESQKEDLSDSQYEGWMGNYGNTIDYWYRRAAIVLWREADNISMCFILDYDQALADIVSLTQKPGCAEPIIDMINQAGRFLYHRRQQEAQEKYFISFTQIAVYLQSEELACTLLKEFSISVSGKESGLEALIKLQNVYGIAWCLRLLETWQARDQEDYHRRATTQIQLDIDKLIHNFITQGGDMQLAVFLVRYHVEAIIRMDKRPLTPVECMKSLNRRITALTKIMYACDVVVDHVATEKIVRHVISHVQLYPELELADLVLNLQKKRTNNLSSAYSLLQMHVEKGIHEELNKGLRSKDDWSLDAKLACTCDYCKVVMEFVKSKTESTKIWPLAAPHREHIIRNIKETTLPISFEVKKQGSPHKLIITKSDLIYKQAQERFERIKIASGMESSRT
ncbi:2OG-Fe(II) oxygenase [Candidatus Regiella endosymbiont of Tuberolachnus salignus]|uniref:2OG-Fe(II) oxygenase n=1 Tax=Candidatus Regiella endosymbiont of Tuberolachnus salignus TaxID=3077956 RepID=UPI0030CB91BD